MFSKSLQISEQIGDFWIGGDFFINLKRRNLVKLGLNKKHVSIKVIEKLAVTYMVWITFHIFIKLRIFTEFCYTPFFANFFKNQHRILKICIQTRLVIINIFV